MGPNLDSCALARGNLRVCGGSNFSSFDRQAPDHRTVQSWDETVSCAVSGMTALRPVIVVRSSVQKPATSASATVRASIAQRLQQQPPNSFLVGNTMLRQDDRSEGLFKQNPVGRPYPVDHPLRMGRQLVDALSRAFAKLYARDGRPPIPPGRVPNGYIYRVVVAWLDARTSAAPLSSGTRLKRQPHQEWQRVSFITRHRQLHSSGF
jgi:hypothetical protein